VFLAKNKLKELHSVVLSKTPGKSESRTMEINETIFFYVK